MDSDIKKLIDKTTIVKVFDFQSSKIIFESKPGFSRFQRKYLEESYQDEQVNLDKLEVKWQKKFESFDGNWNKERQNYRFLYDLFKLFYFSFEQLRFNKLASINKSFGDKFRILHFNNLTGLSLYGMYYHGKKCIDLLKLLKLVNEKDKCWRFLSKFKETRNKLIEHNYNPYGLNLRIDPSIWSLVSTNSLLEIHIHKPCIERAYDVYVDYYEDYYKLESIITKIIKRF